MIEIASVSRYAARRPWCAAGAVVGDIDLGDASPSLFSGDPVVVSGRLIAFAAMPGRSGRRSTGCRRSAACASSTASLRTQRTGWKGKCRRPVR